MNEKAGRMEKRLFKIEERFCDECALALRRFLGHEEGIGSVDVENRMIAVVFDPAKMSGERLHELAKDSLEKLGHRLLE